MAKQAPTYTQTSIDALLAPKRRPTAGRVATAIMPSLDLMVGADGPGKWRVRYRPRGIDPQTGAYFVQKSMVIGTTETHSLREAQAKTAAIKLRVTQGQDPAQADRAAAATERAAVVAAARQAKLDDAARVTCQEKLTEYAGVLRTRGRSEKHQREERAQVRLALTSVGLPGNTPGEITQSHVEKIMAACPVRSQALRFGALDRFLRWACRGQGVPATANFERHERPSLPPPRQRVLSAAEVAAIWMAAGTLKEDVLKGLVGFLVSTPCREGEAARATWADINLPDRTWTMPTSKNGRPHRFPLNDRAVAILEARRKAMGGAVMPGSLVFPAPVSGKVFGGWSNLKASLDGRLEQAMKPHADAPDAKGAKARKAKAEKAAPVAPEDKAMKAWRFHDLRRTAATVLGEAGCDDALVDMLLNHTAAGTRSVLTRTYNVSQRWNDRVRAVAAWGRWIDEALGAPTKDRENVVAMNEARWRVA